MGAGAKVGLLLVALAAAVAGVLWLARDAEPEGGTPLPAPSAAPLRPPRAAPAPRHAEKPKPPKDEGESAPPAPKTSTKFNLVGQVVDAESKPVVDAVVRALRPDGATIETKSVADGKFSLACGPRPATGSITIGVTARAGAGRAGFLTYELLDDAPDEDDVGPLILEPAVPIIARVVDAAGPVAGARICLGSFFGTVFESATTDAHGVAKFADAPVSDAWLFAYAKGRGRARGEVPEERDPKIPLVLKLTARTVRVVVVRTPPDEPLDGERVSARIVTDADGVRLYSSFVPPVDIAPTAADGSTKIEDVALDDAVEVRCGAPPRDGERWRAPRRPANPVVVDARVEDARIEFPAGRTIRWRIATDGAEPPAPGTFVALKPSSSGVLTPGPTHLKVENGELVGAGFTPGPFVALAEADDGAVATLRADSNSERGPDAVFRRPRRVVVSLRDDGGGPIAGASITLKMDDDRGRPVGEAVDTDESGRAEIGGLDPSVGRLVVFESSGKPADVRRLGVVDVGPADANLDAKLPRIRVATVRVTTEGERKLPAGWKLLIDSTWTENAEADEAQAEIRFTARPHATDGSLRLLLRADGYRDVFVAVPAGADVVDAAFDRGVVILADVRGVVPAWTPQVFLETTGDDGAWRGVGIVQQMTSRADADGRRRIERQPPGRYRLRETATSTTSDEVLLKLGDGPAVLVLDLSRAGLVTGRVLGADDKPVAGATITVEDPSAPRPQPVAFRGGIPGRAMTPADGTFGVVVPGDRTVRVRALHPLMKSDPERDSVDVVEPRSDVVLHLAQGPVVEFGVPAGVQRPPMIRLYRGPVVGDAVAQLTVDFSMAFGGGLKRRAGGFEPGRYTVWIDVGTGAPVTLPDVELKDGVTDLGEIRPPRGSTVHVRVTIPPGAAAQMISVVVVRLDQPTYIRNAWSRETDVAVGGLGPGRFEVTVSPQGARREDALKRTVELDGDRDVVIDYPSK
jgi:hypothetical protein